MKRDKILRTLIAGTLVATMAVTGPAMVFADGEAPVPAESLPAAETPTYKPFEEHYDEDVKTPEHTEQKVVVEKETVINVNGSTTDENEVAYTEETIPEGVVLDYTTVEQTVVDVKTVNKVVDAEGNDVKGVKADGTEISLIEVEDVNTQAKEVSTVTKADGSIYVLQGNEETVTKYNGYDNKQEAIAVEIGKAVDSVSALVAAEREKVEEVTTENGTVYQYGEYTFGSDGEVERALTYLVEQKIISDATATVENNTKKYLVTSEGEFDADTTTTVYKVNQKVGENQDGSPVYDWVEVTKEVYDNILALTQDGVDSDYSVKKAYYITDVQGNVIEVSAADIAVGEYKDVITQENDSTISDDGKIEATAVTEQQGYKVSGDKITYETTEVVDKPKDTDKIKYTAAADAETGSVVISKTETKTEEKKAGDNTKFAKDSFTYTVTGDSVTIVSGDKTYIVKKADVEGLNREGKLAPGGELKIKKDKKYTVSATTTSTYKTVNNATINENGVIEKTVEKEVDVKGKTVTVSEDGKTVTITETKKPAGPHPGPQQPSQPVVISNVTGGVEANIVTTGYYVTIGGEQISVSAKNVTSTVAYQIVATVDGQETVVAEVADEVTAQELADLINKKQYTEVNDQYVVETADGSKVYFDEEDWDIVVAHTVELQEVTTYYYNLDQYKTQKVSDAANTYTVEINFIDSEEVTPDLDGAKVEVAKDENGKDVVTVTVPYKVNGVEAETPYTKVIEDAGQYGNNIKLTINAKYTSEEGVIYIETEGGVGSGSTTAINTPQEKVKTYNHLHINVPAEYHGQYAEVVSVDVWGTNAKTKNNFAVITDKIEHAGNNPADRHNDKNDPRDIHIKTDKKDVTLSSSDLLTIKAVLNVYGNGKNAAATGTVNVEFSLYPSDELNTCKDGFDVNITDAFLGTAVEEGWTTEGASDIVTVDFTETISAVKSEGGGNGTPSTPSNGGGGGRGNGGGGRVDIPDENPPLAEAPTETPAEETTNIPEEETAKAETPEVTEIPDEATPEASAESVPETGDDMSAPAAAAGAGLGLLAAAGAFFRRRRS